MHDERIMAGLWGLCTSCSKAGRKEVNAPEMSREYQPVVCVKPMRSPFSLVACSGGPVHQAAGASFALFYIILQTCRLQYHGK